MNVYADYNFYTTEYRGGAAEEEFERQIMKAMPTSGGSPLGVRTAVRKWKK